MMSCERIVEAYSWCDHILRSDAEHGLLVHPNLCSGGAEALATVRFIATRDQQEPDGDG